MKHVCERGLNWFQIYDHKGNVRLCSWTSDGHIGNLIDNSVDELYSGESAKKIRERLAYGDYSLCDIDACPYLAMNEIDKHLVEFDEEQKYPTELYLGFERVCNYDCKCCGIHKCMIKEKAEDLEKHYSKIEERISKLLPHIKKIGANGCGELFCSKHTLKILANWKPLAAPDEVEVLLESNGSLFNETNWKKIENLGQYKLSVAISLMSFDEPVYQYLSGCNLPISQIENNLKFIKTLREKGIINYFEIATVVQEQNFRTMPEFVRKCIEEYNPDYIRLRPYESWGAQSQEEVWITDIRNPEHPYYHEYKKVMADPILQHPLVHDWSGGLDTVRKAMFPYKSDYFKLQILTEMSDSNNAFWNSLEKYTDSRKIIIYGIAVIGKILAQMLMEKGYSIIYIIDQNSQDKTYYDIPVYSMDRISDDEKEELVIITPIINDGVIRDFLRSNGFRKYISVKDLVSNDRLRSELEGI